MIPAGLLFAILTRWYLFLAIFGTGTVPAGLLLAILTCWYRSPLEIAKSRPAGIVPVPEIARKRYQRVYFLLFRPAGIVFLLFLEGE
jgi:hypothetical protein